MAEPNKPKRTSPKSTKAKAASESTRDERIEDAVVVADTVTETVADTLKGAESVLEGPATTSDQDTNGKDETPKDDVARETQQGEKPLDAGTDGETPNSDADTAPPVGTPVEAETTEGPQKDKIAEASETADAAADKSKEVSQEKSDGAQPPFAPMIIAEPQKRGGFAPLVFGGVIAAGLGAGALYVAQDRGWLDLGGGASDEVTALIAQQSTQIDALQTALQAATTRIEELAAATPDLTPMTTALDALQTQTTETSTGLETVAASVAAIDPRIQTLTERINSVETQPIPKAEIPAEVTAAFERKLADMLSSVDTRFGDLEGRQASKVTAIETSLNDKVSGIETTLTEKLAALEAAQSAAAASEVDLAKAASLAEAGSAMARIKVALESGAGFAEDLQTITDNTGIAVPDALSAVATDGVPTLVKLKADYPSVARDALAAATRDAAADGDVSPLSAFLRTQLGARSLAPREGDDPDAVLSRAEAAVDAANLEQAITEISALPQSGQDVLAGWVASAQARLAALDAAAALSAQIDTN